MNINSGGQANHLHRFVFHGQVKSYFILCLVNLILSIVTFGIFIPWAWVRHQRYLAENSELNGMRFGYHGRGGTLLLSGVVLVLVLTGCSALLSLIHPQGATLGMLLFLLLLPVLVVKGLSYHASMTSFHQLRFGFHTSLLRAWWIMLGMPVLMTALLACLLMLLSSTLSISWGMDLLIAAIVLIGLIAFLGSGAIAGLVYSHWLDLIGKSVTLGHYAFNITISSRRCVKILLLALTIQLPFILAFFIILIYSLSRLVTGCLSGLCSESTIAMQISANIASIIIAYFVHLIGIVLSVAYIWAALRNHAINNLVLGNTLQFGSTLTFSGLAPRLLGLLFGSILTLGLAWPWLRIMLARYIATNTTVQGELDALALTQEEMPVQTGNKLCAVFIPTLPFI
ncbi:DUF898 family protein [Pseudenterobacter timonensis]|uniref:DUF898 family protein n=1 Tax=Pseudenterobacter timonensis TaxID=1755099 RepID=A0ABV4A637_9ENTR